MRSILIYKIVFLERKIMSSVLLARTGRHRQRYDNHFRLVAGCIPYRRKENFETFAGDLIDSFEVLMISSPNRDDLVFPKGGWENDETVCQAARREALEEAGIRGNIIEKELGEWVFRSKSSTQSSCSQKGACKGYMFPLEVTEVLDCWPEQASHDRRWVTVMEAFKLCRYDWMREALQAFLTFMSGKRMPSVSELPETPSFCLMQSTVSERAINLIC